MVEIDLKKLQNNIEAVLFSYGDWISLDEISIALGVELNSDFEEILNNIIKKYEKGHTFHVESNENNKYRMALKEEYSDIVENLISNVEIPQSVMKVLSVIAYEQPVTKTRLSEILGRVVKKEVDYLYNNKFLSYEKEGNGRYYKVTKKFYDYFKLEEGEDFKSQADKTIKTFIEDPEKILEARNQ